MYFSAAFVLAALPFLVEAAPFTSTSGGLSVPIAKRSSLLNADGTVNATVLRGSLRNSVAKIHKGFAAFEKNVGEVHPLAASLKSPVKRDGAGDPLTDDNAQLWYGAISVGTPAKTYTVDFDTGSSDLFLPGPDCSDTCSGHTVYDNKASSTSKDVGKTFSLQYGDGSTVSGEQYSDTVSIAGLTATGQTLGAAKEYSTGFQSNQFPADGLLGMGFQSISDYNAPPLFQSLIAQNKVDDQVFGFYFAEQGSELFIGGTNDKLHSGDFTYVPVTKEGYWQIDFDGVSVDGKQLVKGASAIADTGTTQIVGDTDGVKAVFDQIPGAKANDQLGQGLYTIPCNFNTPVSVTFGGKEFKVDPKTFSLGPADQGGSDCVAGLASDDSIGSQFWIFGDVFLQNVYTAFDVGKSSVGFAELA